MFGFGNSSTAFIDIHLDKKKKQSLSVNKDGEVEKIPLFVKD